MQRGTTKMLTFIPVQKIWRLNFFKKWANPIHASFCLISVFWNINAIFQQINVNVDTSSMQH